MTVSRRTFLSGGVAVTAAAARPNRVLGANDRWRVGVIGAGANADAHFKALIGLADTDNVEVVAVCDIYEKRLERAAAISLGRPYRDYRALLDRRDLDYVVISSPNHWHAQMTLDAIDAGEIEQAEELYRSAAQKLDRAGARNIIHRNAAARTKSRLQARIKAAKAEKSAA